MFRKYIALLIGELLIIQASWGQGRENWRSRFGEPTLGLDQGVFIFETPQFKVEILKSTHNLVSLKAKSSVNSIDFLPSDWLERRQWDKFYHLGDLNLYLKMDTSSGWHFYSTAIRRRPIEALPVQLPRLIGSELTAAFTGANGEAFPLEVQRFWEVDEEGNLILRFIIQNVTTSPIEIGGIGIPMIFNNILTGRSLEEAHKKCVFYDPYIGKDAGYLQVTRLNGEGPALLVIPEVNASFEAYSPLLDDPTPRGITFEGFYEWVVHSKAYVETLWKKAEPWNVPSSVVLKPGESRTIALKFILSPSIEKIETTLMAHERPVVFGVPGYVLPMDIKAKLFVKYGQPIESITSEPETALQIQFLEVSNGWQVFQIQGKQWGRARIQIRYTDGSIQTVHYKVIKPAEEVVRDIGTFTFTYQWYENPADPFGRNQSIMTYDYFERKIVTEDNRVWIAGLSDEGGAGSWLTAFMKQLIMPNKNEIEKLEIFVDNVLWGRIQYNEGPWTYGVRKSLFYYEPDKMPPGTYSDDVDYGGWSSWDQEEAESVGRTYNYPHVTAAYWVLYRLARNYNGLVTHHPWQWYLEQAYQTATAMVRYAPYYARFGVMEGTVFVLLLEDLKREGWRRQAGTLEALMRLRAELWRREPFPFGSEMPWDSTGQEEIYAWCRYFGFDEKALEVIRAILGYMPTLPHWGYNGSARRYWDFLFAGKLRRLERQLHHYGSGLNAIPVLSEFRRQPTNLYLLRVGYGGLMGAIANVTQEGFTPCAFHAWPDVLDIDGYSGDYGPNFFGYAINTATYLVDHSEFGWLAFGGNVEIEGELIVLYPKDAARSRVYIAPLGLWLTLDAGRFVALQYDRVNGTIALKLDKGDQYTPKALLRFEQTASIAGLRRISLKGTYTQDRGAFVIPLSHEKETEVKLEFVSNALQEE